MIINGHEVAGKGLSRYSYILDLVREMAGIKMNAEVISENNFPAGAGIASSAAAFAALGAAPPATRLGLTLSRGRAVALGTGADQALRPAPFPAGFVEWQMGTGDDDCRVRFRIAPPEHWALDGLRGNCQLPAQKDRLHRRSRAGMDKSVASWRAWRMLRAGWIFAAAPSSTVILRHLQT
ncbi:MAG: hypothetical protein M0C28_36250 [Candidatus Moduliflexus flocculans]|nr:hypothetical protein [Candidatus Moduliflexus flocculans]